jgi:putative intracellular protease/amidase
VDRRRPPDRLLDRRGLALQAKLEATLRPDQVNADDYVAMYYAGGHGTMWDFPGNEALAGLAARIYEQGKVVAAVCHGVTGLFDIRLSDQRYLVDGRQVTGKVIELLAAQPARPGTEVQNITAVAHDAARPTA